MRPDDDQFVRCRANASAKRYLGDARKGDQADSLIPLIYVRKIKEYSGYAGNISVFLPDFARSPLAGAVIFYTLDSGRHDDLRCPGI
jgi:hypothetical protein